MAAELRSNCILNSRDCFIWKWNKVLKYVTQHQNITSTVMFR